jgi:hypothetical protein
MQARGTFVIMGESKMRPLANRNLETSRLARDYRILQFGDQVTPQHFRQPDLQRQLSRSLRIERIGDDFWLRKKLIYWMYAPDA